MKKCAFALLLWLSPWVFANEDAQNASLSWLAVVDSGRYEDSWSLAASLFQGQISSEDWNAALRGVRTPLGSNLTRDLVKTSAHSALPGVPDGEYVVLVFSSSFEAKKSVQETVTMANSPRGWRVAGYFIK